MGFRAKAFSKARTGAVSSPKDHPDPPVPNFSITIITKNEADNIARCLDALRGLSDDILVLDSYSEDDTKTLAEAHGARVVQQPWLGYAASKNLANDRAHHDWILSIDADEVVSPELADTLRQLDPKPETVYRLDRLTSFCGQWIRHSGWYPDRKPRLFDKTQVEWQGEFVHETLAIPAHFKVVDLPGKLYHYSYRSHAEHLARIDRYSTLAAEELFAKGKNPSVLKTWFAPAARFIRTYFIKRGFLDGRMGWIIAWRNAVMVATKYRKLRWLHYHKRPLR